MNTRLSHCLLSTLILFLTILLSTHVAFAKTGKVLSGDCENGTGTFLYNNGDKYQGQWKNDKKHDSGTYTLAEGDKYEGNFVNDERSGSGTYTWTNGDKYEGNWENGQQNGNGSKTYADGNKYEGNWVNGNISGSGTFTYANGDKYEGNLENDIKNGYGKYFYADGDIYSGNWNNGQKSGIGALKYTSGKEYVGNWLNGKKNGYGKMFNANGDVEQEGNWNNDVYVTPPPAPRYQTQQPTSYVPVPALLNKLYLGMTKSQVLKILGKKKYPSGASNALIDTKKDRWDYYYVGIFDVLWVVYDASNRYVDFIGFAVEDSKLPDETTISNNFYRIQKGQTIGDVLSILGYFDELHMMKYIEGYGDMCASYYDEDYEYDIYFSNGMVCAIEKDYYDY